MQPLNAINAITAVIIRLWAASAIIPAILAMPFYWADTAQDMQDWRSVMVFSQAAWIIIGLIAWIAAPAIAKRVLPARAPDALTLAIDADDIIMLGSFLIGGFYLVEYVPALMTQANYALIQASRQDPNASYELGQLAVSFIDYRELFSNLAIVLIALWMALRPVHLVRLFSYLRHAGAYKEAGAAPQQAPPQAAQDAAPKTSDTGQMDDPAGR